MHTFCLLFPLPSFGRGANSTTAILSRFQFPAPSVPPRFLLFSIFPFIFLLPFHFRPNPGVRIGLFTPGQAFEVVARKQINALKDPATKVVGLVTEELQKTVRDGLDKVRGTLIP